jgi:hypothetical protein
MCAPKAQGGKRCLRHAAGSVSMVRLAEAKTGLDRETVYETLKELNKEGRKLEAPELKEVKEFLNKEEFVVKHDPELSERDRKLILKNLQKAKDEAEKQGVTGGAFHAWKNLLKRSVAKIKKPIIALTLVGGLGLALAGCSGSQTEPPKPPASTSASQPSAACANEELGDVLATKEVKDDKGEYCAVEIDSKAAILKADKSKWDTASLQANGVSDEEAQKAVDTVAKFYTSEGIDSSVVDVSDADQENAWLDKNGSKYVDSEWLDSVKGNGLAYGQLVNTGYAPELIRDGKARISSEEISLKSVKALKNDKGQTEVAVAFSSKTVYRSTDESIINWTKKLAPNTTDAELKEQYPQLFDNKVNGVVVDSNVVYSVNTANNKFTGFSFGYRWDVAK